MIALGALVTGAFVAALTIPLVKYRMAAFLPFIGAFIFEGLAGREVHAHKPFYMYKIFAIGCVFGFFYTLVYSWL